MSNKIELKSIKELLGMNFFIPSYQRGYRWSKQQVKDLLNDIQEFINKEQAGYYCLQPLVVKERVQETFNLIKNEAKDLNEIRNLLKGSWEVIDGQQRLTTVYLILTYFNLKNKYFIDYETREGSKFFLLNIEKARNKENIDFYHIVEAQDQLEDWFKDKSEVDKLNFYNTLLNQVDFIWYESIDEGSIKVFTRLNIGKIPLTNSELIKALFLNRSNFYDADYKKVRLLQQEIASEWDIIENTLQDDEFWFFLNKLKYDKPTRIDFIFNLICEHDSLHLPEKEMKDIGGDEYRTFRYFYYWFKNEPDIAKCWGEIKLYFQTFQEWFNNLELYHYIGYLVECNINISKIIQHWKNPDNTKELFFKEYIVPEIKLSISQCNNLEKQYEINGNPKTQCRPILLLHNIMIVVNQNKSLINTEKYRLPIFYKFPFHLFKKEKWDVEHIDSHTENTLENEEEQKEWLRASFIGITDEKLQEEIKSFLSEAKENKVKFEDLYTNIISYSTVNKLKDNEKDMLWNFTLLDASTNRSYGNAIFPAKRRVIIGKDKGKKIIVGANFEVNETEGAIAFIPPSTKNIFLKYYNPLTNNLREWDKGDAEVYLTNIKNTLYLFL